MPPGSVDDIRKEICKSSSNSGEVSLIQRDLLRQCYLSEQLAETFEFCESKLEYIDSDTALHVLCYVADLSKKGNLRAEGSVQADDLVNLLYGRINLEELNPCSIGALVWCLECIPGQCRPWRAEVLSRIADQEQRQERIETSYSTRELVNLIISIGNLSASLSLRRNVVRYVITLTDQLTKRLESSPQMKGVFGGPEFADTVTACARLYSQCKSKQDEHGMSGIEVFMSKIATLVKQQLSNRHSMMAAFAPRELKRFLAAYVYTSNVENKKAPVMLDTVAGFVSSRILKKHLNAVSKMSDLAAVLECYAFFQHRTLATSELLTSYGYQLRLISAAVVDSVERDKNGQVEGMGDDGEWVAALNSILRSHVALNHRPSDLTLISIMPAIRYYAGFSPPSDVLELLNILQDELQFELGPELLHYLQCTINE
eukprot:jgi/Picsp_1/129/NSC_00129-R1_hypothetical protein VOLCADRAFT_105981 [Volvox carteri f. nagariensis]